MTDIIVTWPAKRSLESYLHELRKARRGNQDINYRVRHPPHREKLWSEPDPRCYRVHDGAVRGYTVIRAVLLRAEGTVARVESDAFSGFWPPGWYVVCSPRFESIEPVPMKGFRGWRWYERTEVKA